MSTATRIITLFVFIAFALVSSARTSQGQQEKSCEVVSQALMEHAKLTVGMKRSDVEKSFQKSGGMTFRLATSYVYQKCEYIHTDIEFEADPKSGNELSPNDVVRKIGPLYLRYPARD